METIFESWGLPKMGSATGGFYRAPYEMVDAPIKYYRVLIGMGIDSKEMQIKFLSGIKNKRFIELQKMTGAYQGKHEINRSQLLDAFHIWCAEHNKCDFFLTLDFKLLKVIRKNMKTEPIVHVVRPSELLKASKSSFKTKLSGSLEKIRKLKL
jgi:hypothetical protein